MKKTIAFMVVWILLLSAVVHGEKVAVLDELTRPAILIVEDGKIFILQDTTVLIYSLADFGLIKKFGKAGEGPGEFTHNPQDMRPMSMSLYQKNILVNSLGRMSYFTFDGEYLKEKKVKADALLFPVGEKFIGIGPINDGQGNQFLGFRLIEEDFEKWKILYSSDLDLGNRARQLLLPIINFTYNPVYKDRIYINTSTSEFVIDVFNSSGDKQYSIRKPYETIPTPDNYKQTCLDWFKNHPRFRAGYEQIKPMIAVREYFPPIRDMQIVEDIIHVITYRQEKGLWECMSLDLKGNELGRTYVPLDKFVPFTFYPILYSVYQGDMYTLIENEDDEQWELYKKRLVK